MFPAGVGEGLGRGRGKETQRFCNLGRKGLVSGEGDLFLRMASLWLLPLRSFTAWDASPGGPVTAPLVAAFPR